MPPGLDYSKFCPLNRPYHRRVSYFAWCHLWHEWWKSYQLERSSGIPESRQCHRNYYTKVGIYTNPMPQHQGGQVTTWDLHRYKLIQDLKPALTSSELAPRREMLVRPIEKEVMIILYYLVTFFVPRNRSSKSRRNHYWTGPPRCRSIHYQEEASLGWKGVEGRMYPNECIGRWKWPLYLKSLRHLLVSQKAFGRLSFLFSHLTTVSLFGWFSGTRRLLY